MSEKITDMQQQGVNAVSKQLREFGYPDATYEVIEAAFRKWQRGEETTDIIEMFAYRSFDDDDYRHIFGEKSDAA